MRAKGEGSVYQRGDGRWVAAIVINGKKLTRYAKSRQEASEKLKELHSQQHTQTLNLPSKVTLADWVDRWLSMQEADLRPSTIQTYRSVLSLVTGIAGGVRLDKLTPIMLSQVFVRLQKQGTGQRRLQLAYGYLKTCLTHAVNLNLIPVNPLLKVKRPKWTPKPRTYWTVQELRRFIKTGFENSGWYNPLFIFLSCSGMRISEALGLTWNDIDLERGTATVNKAHAWSGAAGYRLVLPKTKAGYRTISLPDSALQSVTLMMEKTQGTGDAGVFRSKVNTLPGPSDLCKYLHKLCERAEVPVINIHGLRHVHAHLSMEATQDIYAVQRRLGHSNIHITLATYGYSKREDAELVDRLELLLGKKEGHA